MTKANIEFDLDNFEGNDRADFKLFSIMSDMYSSLHDLDDLRRTLYKGYEYYPPEGEQLEIDGDYQLINVDKLIDRIIEIISDSKINEVV